VTKIDAENDKTPKARRYRGQTPEQLRAERRERLLESALSLFAERGYANSPIELICSTARVTTRHFYEQFDGREALLDALLSEEVSGALTIASDALSNSDRDMTGRVGDAIRGVVLYLTEDTRRARIVCLETVGVSQAMEHRRRRLVHQFAELIQFQADTLTHSGLLPARNYWLPSIALVGATLELIEEWLYGETEKEGEDIAREAVLFYRAVMIGARRYEDEAEV